MFLFLSQCNILGAFLHQIFSVIPYFFVKPTIVMFLILKNSISLEQFPWSPFRRKINFLQLHSWNFGDWVFSFLLLFSKTKTIFF